MITQMGRAGLSLESEQVALFVQTASRFASAISLKKEDKTANAKSIMGLISLGVIDGEALTLTADGADAQEAVAELAKFLKLE